MKDSTEETAGEGINHDFGECILFMTEEERQETIDNLEKDKQPASPSVKDIIDFYKPQKQMPFEPPCMFDGVDKTKVMGLACPCPKCSPRC